MSLLNRLLLLLDSIFSGLLLRCIRFISLLSGDLFGSLLIGLALLVDLLLLGVVLGLGLGGIIFGGLFLGSIGGKLGLLSLLLFCLLFRSFGLSLSLFLFSFSLLLGSGIHILLFLLNLGIGLLGSSICDSLFLGSFFSNFTLGFAILLGLLCRCLSRFSVLLCDFGGLFLSGSIRGAASFSCSSRLFLVSLLSDSLFASFLCGGLLFVLGLTSGLGLGRSLVTLVFRIILLFFLPCCGLLLLLLRGLGSDSFLAFTLCGGLLCLSSLSIFTLFQLILIGLLLGLIRFNLLLVGFLGGLLLLDGVSFGLLLN